jgi:hypothetical protein
MNSILDAFNRSAMALVSSVGRMPAGLLAIAVLACQPAHAGLIDCGKCSWTSSSLISGGIPIPPDRTFTAGADFTFNLNVANNDNYGGRTQTITSVLVEVLDWDPDGTLDPLASTTVSYTPPIAVAGGASWGTTLNITVPASALNTAAAEAGEGWNLEPRMRVTVRFRLPDQDSDVETTCVPEPGGGILTAGGICLALLLRRYCRNRVRAA